MKHAKFSGILLVMMMILSSVPAAFGDGPNTASTATLLSDADPATPTWTSVSEILTANDVRAITALDKDTTSETIKVTGYGFSIPLGAIIDGIVVSVDRQRQTGIGGLSSGTITDASVLLLKGGAFIGTNHATATAWTSGDVTEDHGSASDLWGTVWTPAEINAADFGVALSAKRAGGSPGVTPEARIDSVTVTVTYHIPDVTPPTILGTPLSDVTEEATSSSGATVTYTTPGVDDDIDPSPTIDCLPASGTSFAIGDTTVTCTATDASANTATAEFVVHVVDTTPPVLTVPGDITKAADSVFGATVDYFSEGSPTLSATDNADPSPSISCDIPGGPFPMGTTEVTCTATDSSDYTDTESFNVIVVAGPLASMTLSPDTATITADDTQSYTAEGFDAFGHSIGDITGDTTFTVVDGSCTGAACGSTTAGDHVVTGTDGAVSDDATLTVTAGALASLVVSPSTATITAGDSQEYTSEGFDAYGNSKGDLTEDTTFTIDDGSCDLADCTSTLAGDREVTGTYDTTFGTATLTVTAAGIASIEISPDTATMAAGASQAYTAEGFDTFGNSVGDVTSETTFTIDGGTCTGASCTSTLAGDRTVTGDDGDLIDTATLTVTAGPLSYIVVSPDGSSIVSGSTQTFTAEGFDLYDNTVGDVTAGTVFSIDEGAAGSFAANVYTSSAVGTWTVTGANGELSDGASLDVTALPEPTPTPAPTSSGGGGGRSRNSGSGGGSLGPGSFTPATNTGSATSSDNDETDSGDSDGGVDLTGAATTEVIPTNAITGAAITETGGANPWLAAAIILLLLALLAGGYWYFRRP